MARAGLLLFAPQHRVLFCPLSSSERNAHDFLPARVFNDCARFGLRRLWTKR